MDDGGEIGGDLVVGDGVARGAVVEPDAEEELQALLLLGAALLRRHLLGGGDWRRRVRNGLCVALGLREWDFRALAERERERERNFGGWLIFSLEQCYTYQYFYQFF